MLDANAKSASATDDAAALPACLVGVTKTFGGTVAVSDVSLELRSGEVLALLGENGAGKSTCVKLLAGVHRPDSGSVLISGQAHRFGSPLEAQKAGIAVMHQHPGLFPDLSIAENLFIGQTGTVWHIDHEKMEADAQRLLSVVGLDVDVSNRLGKLRTSEQQLVEVARALSLNARVLIMDEPTAALSQREVERLFAVVASLRKRGVAMMFVGHRMDEIYRVSDRIAVLRDGRLIGTELVADLSREKAIQMMVGRALDGLYPRHASSPGNVLLDVKELSRQGAFDDVSFELRAREILGFGGLVGSGRTEIARVLFGIDRPTAGSIILNGRPANFSSANDAMEQGIAYVSEDRIGQSLVMDFSILSNASLTVLEEATKGRMMSRSKELRLAMPFLDRLRLRFSSYDQPVSSLSGGNQQKVVLSKWLATKPRILILDEPTQGIDVQAKADVHAMMADLASQGMAIILISSELPELLGMSDRMIVLREGRISGRFTRDEASQEKVIAAATDAIVENIDRQVVAVPAYSEEQHTSPGTQSGRGGRIFARREFGLFAAMLAVILPISFLNIRMLSGSNLSALAMDAGLLMIVAIAQMLVLVTRNIDLSVAAVIGLAAYGAASTLHVHPGIGVLGGVLLASGLGLFAGLVNGLIVTYGRVPAIVVTLGTMSVFRGLNSIWAGGTQVSADQVPQAWLDLTSASVFGVPAIILIAILTLLAAGYVLRYTSFGRELYAIGSNPDGARLIGIPTKSRILAAFTAAGLLAGFDGALWASRYATVDARVAYGFELTVIAAAVVGGVAVRGGSGTVLGVAAGALLLLVINNGLTLVRVDPLWLQGVYGLVILAAIAIDAYVARRASRTGAPS
ncbi:ATP-binding cassette domain-containing protein [Oryzifoliimicrobium ureilyticus]|uniref:ATP-binding cassette domain-containing protein n=1 Tax=Oryzifoliimicrobium ureilyticus TaxID=3113724 RepID=UPI0030765241